MDGIMDFYDEYINRRADPRTDSWFLVHSPWPPVIIAAVYILISWNAKKFSQNFPAWQLRWLLVVYNLALVALSAYMTYEFAVTAYLSGYNLLCQPADYSYDPLALRMASVCWWYFISKYIELLDTAFFILRKKYNQVSFLHVYHHTTMLFNWWIAVKYIAGGHSFFIGMINSFIHVIMYFYYGMSSIGPHMQKYLWWKKYLTGLQIMQFFLILFHCASAILIGCDFPNFILWIVIVYQVSLIILFTSFYRRSYRPKAE